MYGSMNMSGKMGKGRGQGAKPGMGKPGMKKPGMSRGQAAKTAPKKMTKPSMKRGM